MLTGQNGILTNAQNANTASIYYSAEEQVKLAYMAVKTEIMVQKTSNSEYDATQNIGKLAKIVSNELKEGKEWTITPDGTDENEIGKVIVITYTSSKIGKDKISAGIPGENGRVEYRIILDKQNASVEFDTASVGFGIVNEKYKKSFGKVVKGYTLQDGTVENGKWRLFYADEARAYLIRDSIYSKGLHQLENFGVEISTLGKNLNSQFKSWDLKTDGTNLNNNIIGISALLDTSDTSPWNKYKASYAVYAIGAPTLEMFIASYNATHNDSEFVSNYNATHSIEISEIRIDSIVDSAILPGYKVRKVTAGGTLSNYQSAVTNLGKSSELDQAIYCHSSKKWWLSSPAAGKDVVMFVNFEDNGRFINNNGTYKVSRDIRPLVSIPISKLGNEIEITDNY